jgi:uncharacterized protein YciI
MTKFITILKDKKEGTLTTELLNRHVEHLRAQTQAGHIFLCGPFNDNNGALQVIMVSSKEGAEAILPPRSIYQGKIRPELQHL